MSTARLMTLAASNKKTPKVAFLFGGDVNSLTSVDISNPSSPTLLQSINVGRGQTSVFDASNGRLFALLGGGDNFVGISAVDVSNPSAMSGLGSIGLSSETGGSFGSRRTIILDVARQIAFVLFATSSGRGVVSVDVSNPAAMSVLGQLNFSVSGTSTNQRYSGALDLSTNTLHVSDQQSERFYRINVTNAASMSSLGSTSASSLRASDNPTGVALDVAAGKAFFVGGDGNLNGARIQSVNLSGGGYSFGDGPFSNRASVAVDPINSIVYESYEQHNQDGAVTQRGIRSRNATSFAELDNITQASAVLDEPGELQIDLEEQLLFTVTQRGTRRLTIINTTSAGSMSIRGSLILPSGNYSLILGAEGPAGTRAYS